MKENTIEKQSIGTPITLTGFTSATDQRGFTALKPVIDRIVRDKLAKELFNNSISYSNYQNMFLCIAKTWYEKNIREHDYTSTTTDYSYIKEEANKLYKTTNLEAWCATLVWFILNEFEKTTGCKNPLKFKDALATTIIKDLISNGINCYLGNNQFLKTTTDHFEIGDIFYRYAYNRDFKTGKKLSDLKPPEKLASGHCGFIIGVSDDSIYTLEGNIKIDTYEENKDGLGIYRYTLAEFSNPDNYFVVANLNEYYKKCNIQLKKYDYVYYKDGKQYKNQIECKPKDLEPDKPKILNEKPLVEAGCIKETVLTIPFALKNRDAILLYYYTIPKEYYKEKANQELLDNMAKEYIDKSIDNFDKEAIKKYNKPKIYKYNNDYYQLFTEYDLIIDDVYKKYYLQLAYPNIRTVVNVKEKKWNLEYNLANVKSTNKSTVIRDGKEITLITANINGKEEGLVINKDAGNGKEYYQYIDKDKNAWIIDNNCQIIDYKQQPPCIITIQTLNNGKVNNFLLFNWSKFSSINTVEISGIDLGNLVPFNNGIIGILLWQDKDGNYIVKYYDKKDKQTKNLKVDTANCKIIFPIVEKAELESICTTILTTLPSASQMQYFDVLKQEHVRADITNTDMGNQNAKRNGSALWFNNSIIDTHKATGFGLFKDRVKSSKATTMDGNFIYVLDMRQESSRQLLLQGLVDGTPHPESQEVKHGQIDKSRQWKYFESESKKSNFTNAMIIEIIGANDENNFMSQDKPDVIYINGKSVSEFNKIDKNRYDICLANCNDEKNSIKIEVQKRNGGLYLIDILTQIQSKGILLGYPIVAGINAPSPPEPPTNWYSAISSGLSVVSSIASIIPIPIVAGAGAIMGKIASGISAVGQATTQGINLSTISDLGSAMGGMFMALAPETAKGLEKDATKFIKDNVFTAMGSNDGYSYNENLNIFANLKNKVEKVATNQLRGISMTNIIASAGLKDLNVNNFGVSGFVSGVDTLIAKAGLKTPYKASSFIRVDGIETIINSLKENSSLLVDTANKFNPTDITKVLSGGSLPQVNRIISNMKTELTLKNVGYQLNSESMLSVISTNLDKLAKIPLVSDIGKMMQAGSSMIGLPNMEKFATAMINNSAIKNGEDNPNPNEMRANLIASAMGYTVTSGAVFNQIVKKSLENEIEIFNKKNEGKPKQDQIPFVIPATIPDEFKECYKYEFQRMAKNTPIISDCPEGWEYDRNTQQCKRSTGGQSFVGETNISTSSNITKVTDSGGGGTIETPKKSDTPSGDIPSNTGGGDIPNCFTKIKSSIVFVYNGLNNVVTKDAKGWYFNLSGVNTYIDLKTCKPIIIEKPFVKDIPKEETFIVDTPKVTIFTEELPSCIQAVSTSNGKAYYLNTQGRDYEVFKDNKGIWYTTINNKRYDVDLGTCTLVNSNEKSNTPPETLPNCISKEGNNYYFFAKKYNQKFRAYKTADNQWITEKDGLNYYVDLVNCLILEPDQDKKPCEECETRIVKELETRRELQKEYNNYKSQNDSVIREYISEIDRLNKKSKELENQIIKGNKDNDSSEKLTYYNDMLEREKARNVELQERIKSLENFTKDDSTNVYKETIEKLDKQLRNEKERNEKANQEIYRLQNSKEIQKTSEEKIIESLPPCIYLQEGKYIYKVEYKQNIVSGIAFKDIKNNWYGELDGKNYVIKDCTILVPENIKPNLPPSENCTECDKAKMPYEVVEYKKTIYGQNNIRNNNSECEDCEDE